MTRPSQPRRDRETPLFEVYPREGESFEAATLRTALVDHPHGQVIQSILSPVIERACALPPGSVHPDAVPGLDTSERMSRLAESFPTLVGRPGVRPWNPRLLDDQLDMGWPGAGARNAIRFVLEVYGKTPSGVGGFALSSALNAWDAANRAAFVAWASRPWWP